MTDDRAKRLRDLRNRTTGGGSDDDEEARSSAESNEESEAADESGESEATAPTDEPNEPTESADGSGEETDGAAAEPVSESVPEATESESDQRESRAEDSDSAAQDESRSQPQSDPVSKFDGERTTSGSETDSAAETVSFDEDEAVANSVAAEGGGRAVRADASDTQPEEAIESKLGGAIADTSTLAMETSGMNGDPTVDSSAVMEESTEYGQSTVGRDTAVLEQDSTLLHSTHDDENTVQMLEFYLNENRYAIEIERISAIVEMKEITRFPRGPEAIDGVTDLRGEITGVLDPTTMLDVERNELSSDQYIVVLKRDDDKQKLGIRVTDVLQAVTYRESQIDETGTVMDTTGDHQHEFITGIIKKSTDGETSLVTWLDIDKIIENTG